MVYCWLTGFVKELTTGLLGLVESAGSIFCLYCTVICRTVNIQIKYIAEDLFLQCFCFRNRIILEAQADASAVQVCGVMDNKIRPFYLQIKLSDFCMTDDRNLWADFIGFIDRLTSRLV